MGKSLYIIAGGSSHEKLAIPNYVSVGLTGNMPQETSNAASQALNAQVLS